MSHIFISYSSKDGSDVAHQLLAALEATGRRCWIMSRDMKPGWDYPSQIVEAVCAAQALMLVLTPEANESRTVRREVQIADEENKLIVPVIVGGTQPSSSLRLFVGVPQRITWTEAEAVARALGEVFAPATDASTIPAQQAEAQRQAEREREARQREIEAAAAQRQAETKGLQRQQQQSEAARQADIALHGVIAIANEEAKVGKTTTAVNLAASLAASELRVLLVDLDPRGKATMYCGVDKSQLQWTTCNVLLEEIEIRSALVAVDPGGYALLGANQDLRAAEVRLLTGGADGATKLRHSLESLRGIFDVILVDCPPSLNMLTVNSLVAADSVLIPMQCEYYAMEGLSALLNIVEQLRGTVNPHLEIEGLLRTMHDPRDNLASEVSAQLLRHFGEKVFHTIIPRNMRLAEAPSIGQPVLFHDRESRGATSYLALAAEMIQRWNNSPAPEQSVQADARDPP